MRRTKRTHHGHSGNVKKFTVLSRAPRDEWAEMIAHGCTDVDQFTPTHGGLLRQTQADQLAARLRATGLETKLINVKNTNRG
jgi:phage replication-related protein YjqB (UPF0714/DUF867 family)